eukprot:1143152-Rhodomonas_salina.2
MRACGDGEGARAGNMGLIFRPSSHSKSTRTISVTNHPRNQSGGHPAAVPPSSFSRPRVFFPALLLPAFPSHCVCLRFASSDPESAC